MNRLLWGCCGCLGDVGGQSNVGFLGGWVVLGDGGSVVFEVRVLGVGVVLLVWCQVYQKMGGPSRSQVS